MLKEYPFDTYGFKQIRVIDDTDCACEGDDAFAVAHILMTSKFDVRAITAAQYLYDPNSVEKSYEAVRELVKIMGLQGTVPILCGSPPMKSENEFTRSEASDFIVEEARREDPRPLFVACQGALTNLAAALKTDPSIASKIQCIWIGGAAYPKGGGEFNLLGDVTAARTVMESKIPLWQVPQNVYAMMRVSFMTIYNRLKNCGQLGKYLYTQLWEAHERMARMSELYGSQDVDKAQVDGTKYTGFACGEIWTLGDSPVVGLMMNCQEADRDCIGAPYIRDDGTYEMRPDNPRKIYVYRSIDSYFILEDFFDKMRFQFSEVEDRKRRGAGK